MKVAMLALSMYGYAAALAAAVGRRVEMDFFCSDYHLRHEDPNALERLEGVCRVRQFTYKRFRDPRNLAHARSVAKAIRDGGYGVLHLQEYADPWMALAWREIRHIPMVLTVHDPYQHSGLSFVRRCYQDAMLLVYARRASRYIVLGEALKVALLKRCPFVKPAQVFTTPIALGARSGEVVPPPPGLRQALFFGQVRHNKGLDVLLAAERLMRGRAKDYEIVVAGACDDPEHYAALLDRDAPVRMSHGFIPDAEVPGYFQRASVVVLPYRSATQSGNVPMAYAHGRPVVATAVGAVPELVRDGETGLLIPPEDPQALADALVAILNDDARRQAMGEAARRFSETYLSPDAIAQATVAVYEDAIRGAKR